MRIVTLFLLLMLINTSSAIKKIPKPVTSEKVRIAIAGLSHGHARIVFRLLTSEDVAIVGISESDSLLALRFRENYNLPPEIFYKDLDDMLDIIKPEGVAVFTYTRDHLQVIEKCAQRGIHVMVEKPLAINYEHAKKIEKLGRKHSIHIITNYETTWHTALDSVQSIVFKKNLAGTPRKIIFHHGNSGPKKGRGVDEFVEWLTDPELNGGGAIMDFGCYGINILTSWLNGEKPISVYTETRNFHLGKYPVVDDDATIILNYQNFNCIIMASWNWAVARKDVEIYGDSGYIVTENAYQYRYRFIDMKKEVTRELEENNYPVNKPFSYFAEIIRNNIDPQQYEPCSLENNLIVMQILDAARKSAHEHKVIFPN